MITCSKNRVMPTIPIPTAPTVEPNQPANVDNQQQHSFGLKGSKAPNEHTFQTRLTH